MTSPDLLAALAPVLDALGRLHVRHYVAGSIASSVHGLPRASIDADVVADLRPSQTAAFIEAVRGAYYVPEQRVADAVERRASFNLIHLETLVKVDVFVSRDRPFDRRALDRAADQPVVGDSRLPIASAEDTVLAKLEWFRRGGEVSQRQWGDVLGLLRIGDARVDREYLRHGALEIGVADLLERAWREAGA